ncbi:aldose 1-epimerase family protein [Ralstonia insidiosa]|uniref:Aldose 1-epimerase family protein n=1 Tax=Ralstonia insidiosa TaxID=190721 RepID=A0AAC9BKX9_9RALS|nr:MULTISPECIES: aldose 1-epimerase [Ralstonia]ANH74463.1 aldose 1-epimerase family protein [Ralstonia insidiosa]EPX97917.1 aldose 1-epimerase [Ralstonia sp. AU12-08]
MHDLPTARFQDRTLVRIGDVDDPSADGSMLLLAPEAGGRLARWRHLGEEILFWPEHADWSNPAKVRGGNPLLFPFIGRHFVDGEIGQWRDARGQRHALPQHGFARDLPFEVEDASDTHIVMLLRDRPQAHEGYPFTFEFRITYRLLIDGLEATFSVKHLDKGDIQAPMPFYAGHHFYFALPHALRSAAELSMPPSRLSRQLADGSLDMPEPGRPTYRFDDTALQDRYHLLDDAGAATLIIPPHADAPLGRRIHIEVDGAPVPWHAITTWTENATSDFYCVEPWMGLPNAIHHGEGLHLLAPGETRQATCRLRITR